MAIRLNPYLSFDGNARSALEFYESVFGGTLSLNTFGETGGLEGAKANEIMHGMLVANNGLAVMAADMPPGVKYEPGNNFSVSLSGEGADGTQLREYWAKLSSNGNITVAFETQMWGDEFGMCVDSFGVTWMVNIAK